MSTDAPRTTARSVTAVRPSATGLTVRVAVPVAALKAVVVPLTATSTPVWPSLPEVRSQAR